MTAPRPTPPNGHPVRPDSPQMSPGEKVAAEWEARHDVSARGPHGNPAAIQEYLTHARSAQLRHAPPAHPADEPPPAEQPSPPTAAEARPRSWLRRLFRRRG